jgi:hypothetical protein
VAFARPGDELVHALALLVLAQPPQVVVQLAAGRFHVRHQRLGLGQLREASLFRPLAPALEGLTDGGGRVLQLLSQQLVQHTDARSVQLRDCGPQSLGHARRGCRKMQQRLDRLRHQPAAPAAPRCRPARRAGR